MKRYEYVSRTGDMLDKHARWPTTIFTVANTDLGVHIETLLNAHEEEQREKPVTLAASRGAGTDRPSAIVGFQHGGDRESR